MNVTLIANEFSEGSGHGIARYSNILLEEIRKQINIEKVELKPAQNLIRIPIIKNILIKNYYFTFKKELLRNKNIHLLEPILMPKFLSLPAKKIVTVHDLYRFNNDFIRTAGEGYKGFYKIGAKILAKSYFRSDKLIYNSLKYYDHIFVINEKLIYELVSRFNIDRSKISITYDPVSKKFKSIPDLKEKTKKVIGYINGFGQNKIIKLRKFIDEFKKIKDNDLELRIYGSKFPLTNLINNDKRIKYLGFLPEKDIVKIYNSFNVYLSTSTVEGFGLPIIQAKACKIPVLCYDGDVPQIVKRNTLIWNDENLEDLIKNRSWEKIDVEKAYLDAEECRADKVVLKTMNIYNKIFS